MVTNLFTVKPLGRVIFADCPLVQSDHPIPIRIPDIVLINKVFAIKRILPFQQTTH